VTRNETLGQVEQQLGMVPGFIKGMPDMVLEQYWKTLSWVLSDTGLSARDKALVALGAATAIHCPY